MSTSTLSRFQRGALAQLVSEKHKTRQAMADEILAALELINQRPLKMHHQRTTIESFRACSD